MKTLFTLLLALSMTALTFPADLSAQKEVAEEDVYYGEKISGENAMSFEKLLKKMKKKDKMEAKVRGTVASVCQKKGCWMTMEEDGQELFIKFKDYGFFMPKDIDGREVIVEGEAFKEVVAVDELRHLAEDAGKTKEEIMKITEPKEELRFMAHGVILVPES